MNSVRIGIAPSKLWWAAGCLGLCCSLTLHAASLQCKGVTLSLIDQSARANLNILEGGVTDTEIEEALQMPGNLALVKKSNQTGASNTIDDLRSAFIMARDGKTPDPDLFGISRLRRDLKDAKDLLALLDRDAKQIVSGVAWPTLTITQEMVVPLPFSRKPKGHTRSNLRDYS